MTLRIPNPVSNQQTLLDLQRMKERYADLQEQISTGKRINRLGQDPTGAALVIDFKNSVERNNQYARTIQSARSSLSASETVVDSVQNTLVRVMELAEQGGSSTLGASGRKRIAEEVDGLRTQFLNLSNTQFEGRYLFAGSRTTVTPFSGPAAGPIAYAGDNTTLTLDVSTSMSAKTNIPGDSLFFGTGGAGSATDLFKQVTDLRDALLADNTAGIQAAYANIKGIHNNVNDVIADIGGRQATLNQLEDNLGAYNLSLQSIQDTYESVDYPSAITEWSRIQTAQQAALGTLAKSGKLSLFDYIG